MRKNLKISTNHVSLKVKDLQESFRFYHQVLQLPIIRVIGPKDKPSLIFLQGLELSQMKLEEEWVQPKTGFFGHIGFEVENIEAWIKKLEKENVQFITRFREVKFEKENMAVKICFFPDPDDILLELVEWRELH